MDYPIIPERPSMLLPPFFLHHKYLFHTVKVNALSNSAGLGQPELQFWWVPQNWTIKRIQNIKLHIFVMMHHFLKLNHIQCSQCTKKCLAKSLQKSTFMYCFVGFWLQTLILAKFFIVPYRLNLDMELLASKIQQCIYPNT